MGRNWQETPPDERGSAVNRKRGLAALHVQGEKEVNECVILPNKTCGMTWTHKERYWREPVFSLVSRHRSSLAVKINLEAEINDCLVLQVSPTSKNSVGSQIGGDLGHRTAFQPGQSLSVTPRRSTSSNRQASLALLQHRRSQVAFLATTPSRSYCTRP